MTLSPLETVRSYYNSLALGRRQILMELLHPRVKIELQEGFPCTQRSYDGLKAYFEEFLFAIYGAFDLDFLVEEFLQCGPEVAAVGRHKGRALRTSIPFDVPFIHLWTIEDGYLVHGRMFTDTAVLRDAVMGTAALDLDRLGKFPP